MNIRDWRDVLRRRLGRCAFPHQLWFLLEFPGRRLILAPEKLADRLHLATNSRVLEIGPGSGFWSLEVGRRVPDGHLELFDLQPKLLERARRKIEKAGLRNVGFTQGDARALPFAQCDFDVAFLICVLGEVPDQTACVREAFRVLRAGGLLSVTEQWPDPDFIPLGELHPLTETVGFTFVESFGQWRGYTANFRKPAAKP